MLAQPHPVGSPGDPTRRPELLSRAKLNPVVKNYTCLEIWDHSLSGSPHLPAPTFGRNCSKRHWPPLQMRKLERRSGGKRTTHSWFVKGLPLKHSNHSACKFLPKAEFTPLQVPAPPKAVLLSLTWLLSSFVLMPLIWRIKYCYYSKRSITTPEIQKSIAPVPSQLHAIALQGLCWQELTN